MYQLEKNYVILAKEGKKLADAGFLKTSLNDHKIKAEYFLDAKQIQKVMASSFEWNAQIKNGIEIQCELRYSQEGEPAAVKIWKKMLTRTESHFIFAIESSKEMKQIMDCRLILPGNLMIVADEKMSITDSESDLHPEKADLFPQRIVEYIRDLEYLKTGNEEMQQLYYNSFLLHGFYQYRYFILAKDFIGVPDHFYEREAIAAKMMGFPYFMEADYVEMCSLDGETRTELPKTGSFGYYMRKLS